MPLCCAKRRDSDEELRKRNAPLPPPEAKPELRRRLAVSRKPRIKAFRHTSLSSQTAEECTLNEREQSLSLQQCEEENTSANVNKRDVADPKQLPVVNTTPSNSEVAPLMEQDGENGIVDNRAVSDQDGGKADRQEGKPKDENVEILIPEGARGGNVSKATSNIRGPGYGKDVDDDQDEEANDKRAVFLILLCCGIVFAIIVIVIVLCFVFVSTPNDEGFTVLAPVANREGPKVIGACLQKPCQNGGACFASPDTPLVYVCTCRTGYSGPNCTHPDPCIQNSSHCKPHGKCMKDDVNLLYRCSCDKGYTGETCDHLMEVCNCKSNTCGFKWPNKTCDCVSPTQCITLYELIDLSGDDEYHDVDNGFKNKSNNHHDVENNEEYATVDVSDRSFASSDSSDDDDDDEPSKSEAARAEDAPIISGEESRTAAETDAVAENAVVERETNGEGLKTPVSAAVDPLVAAAPLRELDSVLSAFTSAFSSALTREISSSDGLEENDESSKSVISGLPPNWLRAVKLLLV